MRVIVYAIARNEEANVRQFMQCADGADAVYVLVNNSTDSTADQLIDAGAVVQFRDYKEFRFDKARNDSLAFVKEHEGECLCVYLDLDEYLPPGWYNRLQETIEPNVDAYKFGWYWENNGQPFTYNNIRCHKLNAFMWKYPVHEVLVPQRESITKDTDIVVSHYPVPKERNYLPLLQKAFEEDPDDLRCSHYLGRELMYMAEQPGATAKELAAAALQAFERYLHRVNSLRTFGNYVWKAELSQIHIYMAQCYIVLEDWWSTEQHYIKAISEFPEAREPYIELSQFYLKCFEYESALGMAASALRIKHKPTDSLYSQIRVWGGLPHHIMAVCYKELGLTDKALDYVEQSLKIDPAPETLQTYAAISGKLPDNLEQYGLKVIKDEDKSTA